MASARGLNDQYLISNIINQKYEPLLNVKVSQDDSKTCGKMLAKRFEALKDLNINLFNLEFSGVNLVALAKNQNNKGMLQPIAVVSSNRSKWIRKTYDVGLALSKTDGPFKSVRDTKALKEGPVPIYAPYRFVKAERQKRLVYIFVHISEYTEYKKNLAGTDLIVVGWNINGSVPMVGFGASRFAAIEFFKNVYKKKGAMSKVWMFDDNTCFIRKFPKMSVVEAQMDKLKCTGLGFKGDTVARTKETFTGLNTEPSNYNDAATKVKPTTILQQAVLWNLDAFVKGKINFSPLFFSAAEDVSFTHYITPKKAIWYESCTILKSAVEESGYDNGQGAADVKKFKAVIGKSFYEFVKGTIPFTASDIKGKTLNSIVLQAKAIAAAKDTLENTYSRSIEQILKIAMGKGVKNANITNAFQFSQKFNISIINA